MDDQGISPFESSDDGSQIALVTSDTTIQEH